MMMMMMMMMMTYDKITSEKQCIIADALSTWGFTFNLRSRNLGNNPRSSNVTDLQVYSTICRCASQSVLEVWSFHSEKRSPLGWWIVESPTGIWGTCWIKPGSLFFLQRTSLILSRYTAAWAAHCTCLDGSAADMGWTWMMNLLELFGFVFLSIMYHWSRLRWWNITIVGWSTSPSEMHPEQERTCVFLLFSFVLWGTVFLLKTICSVWFKFKPL